VGACAACGCCCANCATSCEAFSQSGSFGHSLSGGGASDFDYFSVGGPRASDVDQAPINKEALRNPDHAEHRSAVTAMSHVAVEAYAKTALFLRGLHHEGGEENSK
jgi:hypothetical protein